MRMAQAATAARGSRGGCKGDLGVIKWADLEGNVRHCGAFPRWSTVAGDGNSLAALWQDIRFRLRAIVRRPGTTIVAVLSLALGIGANTAVFSIVDGTFLRPWSVESPDELVWVRHRAVEGQGDSMAYADYVDLREQSTVFSDVAAESRRGGLLRVGGEASSVLVNVVSENFFAVMGVDAALGRTFAPRLDTEAGDPGLIISHDLWTRRFGQDPGIVGESIELTGSLLPVVGVMPASYRVLARMLSVDIWVPPAVWVTLSGGNRDEFDHRGTRSFDVLGRLRPGVSLAEAEAQLTTIAERLREAYPATNRERTFYPVAEVTERRSRGLSVGLMFMSVVGAVLLIACANVATLVIADAETRGRETVVRLALGAGRARLIRQFLAESLIVAVLATIVGLFFAAAIMRVFPALMPPGPVSVGPDLRIDHRVLSVTLVASLATLFLFGLAPALKSSKQEIVNGLRGEEVRIGDKPGVLSLRNMLVVFQMALCVALITGAGLVVRSFLHSRSLFPGFDADQNMLIATVARARGEPTPHQVLYEEVAADLEALPGVRAVTWARRIPFSSYGGGASRRIEFPEQEPVNVKFNQVAPEYFEVMGTRILRGRPFGVADRAGSAPVAMINQTMAERFWPGRDPLGANLRVSGTDHEVIGVVEDGKINSLHEDPEPLVYLAYAQAPSGDTSLLIATEGDPTRAAGGVLRVLGDRESSIMNLGLMTLAEHMRRALYEDRMPAQIGGALGALGILLASVGLYGVISRLVNQRRREFGIRLALGARRSEVVSLVLAQGLKLSLFGIGLGVVFALAVGRLMESSLHGISPADPLTLLVSCAIVALVGLLASHVPTRRATRVDPMEVLRDDV